MQASSPAPRRPAARLPPARSLPPGGLDDAGYFAVADHLQLKLDRFWDERRGHYVPRPTGTETEVNGDLLIAHSVAAMRGHRGASRNDHRARLIARWLVDGEVWVETPRPGTAPGAHGPSFVHESGGNQQHMVFNAEAVDGLVHAYQARHALQLPDRTVALIKDRIRRLAAGPDWRWPALRLNQFNWYVEIFAATALVNGENKVLTRGMQRHLARFAAGVQGRRGGAGNFGAGMRFHYLPERPSEHPMNVDSAEYANIVLSFTRYYGQARQAGMPRPPAGQRRLFRNWIRRAIAGYWTHSGYLNWDSGLGFARWHQAKKLGLAQLALIGIARSGDLAPSPAWRSQAKWLLDRSLTWYDRMAGRTDGIPPGLLFDVSTVPVDPGSADLTAARVAGNAARAVAAGLGREVGGADPAGAVRLRPRHRPAGRHDAPLQHRDRRRQPGRVPLRRDRARAALRRRAERRGEHRRAAACRVRRDRPATGRPCPARLPARPLRIGAAACASRAPRRASAPSAATRGALAGAFTDLRAVGSVRGGGVSVTSRYRFTPGWIEGDWSVRRRNRRTGRRDVPEHGPRRARRRRSCATVAASSSAAGASRSRACAACA